MLKDWSKKSNLKAERVNYTAEFIVDSSFGEPGAITVTNKHQKEFFLESITIEGFASGPVHFPCNSWVQSRKDLPGKRIFFSNKVIFPEFLFILIILLLLFCLFYIPVLIPGLRKINNYTVHPMATIFVFCFISAWKIKSKQYLFLFGESSEGQQSRKFILP